MIQTSVKNFQLTLEVRIHIFRILTLGSNRVERKWFGFQLEEAEFWVGFLAQENGKQTILQLGRIGKSKYVMDYR